MKIESVKLVYFSPTGTTKAVVQGIAHCINPGTMELIDITRPDARKQPLLASENELLVIVVPVYMGRVPALLNEWLNAIQAHNTPTVCVVVYGNRVYDDALLELKNIVMKCGCIPIACAAYIGEHSFSNSETPTAQGRPAVSDWDRIDQMPEFKALMKAKARFIVPACIFFIVYYFTLPALVGWAPKFMETKVFGPVNIAYLFALSQFFMAWIIAALYLRAAAKFDKMEHRVIEKAFLSNEGKGR